MIYEYADINPAKNMVKQGEALSLGESATV